MGLDLNKATMGEIIRLEHVQKYLKISSLPEDPQFFQEVIEAALGKIRPTIRRTKPTSGEAVISAIAESFGVHFEEVRTQNDIHRLEQHYLRNEREIGFAQLAKELAQPGIDALLFQLARPDEGGRERFVAVLDLRISESRGYWDRSHELSHRLAEPPQMVLPFRRHQGEAQLPVERLMDGIAAEIAFYRPLFQPIVSKAAESSSLTMRTILAIRQSFAPSASILSAANAVAKCWPRPAIVLTAEMRGRLRSPNRDVALRVAPQAANILSRSAELFIPNNMRVPSTSPLFAAFTGRCEVTDTENLHSWTSSDGGCLRNVSVLTSAIRFNEQAYAVISIA